MKKFFVMFGVPVAMLQEWEKTPEDQMKNEEEKMMKDWNDWMERHKAAFIQEAQPLGSTKRVANGKVTDVRNEMAMYAIVKAESHEAAAQMFVDNPHFQVPQAYIEVMELSDME